MKRRLPRCVGRRGLAPLELVIALPLFLMLLGLIINFGYSASWKVKALTTARHGMWRDLEKRQAPDSTARVPPPWPDRAGQPTSGGSGANLVNDQGSLSQLDQHIALRGPTVGTFSVNDDLLDFSRGDREGSASTDGDMPVLQGVPNVNRFAVDEDHPILDQQWEHYASGFGLGAWNQYGRPGTLYELPPPESSPYYAEALRLVQMLFLGINENGPAFWPIPYAVPEDYGPIDYPPLRPGNPAYPLQPLDNDWYLRSDFHPTIPPNLARDNDWLPDETKSQMDSRVYDVSGEGGQGLVHRIRSLPSPQAPRFTVKGVPNTLAEAYRAMFEREERRLEQEIEAAKDLDPPNPGLVAALEAELDELNPNENIQDLEEVLGRLWDIANQVIRAGGSGQPGGSP